jgi:CRP-like cAMP-binding protein
VHSHLRPFLDRLIAHSRLNDAEQEAVLSLPQRYIGFDPNKVIVAMDAATDHSTVVIEGVVARFRENDEGERQFIALAIPGDAPDLHTIVVPSHTVPLVTITKSAVVSVPHPALRAIAAKYPALAEAFWRHSSIDAAITAAWVVNVNRRATRLRICHLVCELAVRFKTVPKDGELLVPFPLTQSHLANAIGVSQIHVNRTVKALRDDGVVVFAGRTAHIPNWHTLVEQGKFNRDYLMTDVRPGERLRVVD